MARGYSGSGMGARLEQIILGRHGTTVRAFAIAHRFDYNYVWRWINRGEIPTYEELLRLCTALDVSPAWLFFGDDAYKVPSPPGPRDASPAAASDARRVPSRRSRATVKRLLVGASLTAAALLGGAELAYASSSAAGDTGRIPDKRHYVN